MKYYDEMGREVTQYVDGLNAHIIELEQQKGALELTILKLRKKLKAKEEIKQNVNT